MGIPLSDLTGRGVLITGASSGIGRAFAERCASDGARLALVARTEATLRQTAERARELGAREARIYPCDVSDRAAVTAALERVEADLDGVDVAVINAGVGRHRALIDHSLDDAEQLLRTNVLGALYTAHPIARAMARRGRGWIVFTASIAGLLPVPGEAVYSASKHAVVGLGEALSMELEPRGVHVLTVCPGAVRTGFLREDERLPSVAERTAIGPDEVAGAIVRGLAEGRVRLVVPASLGVAVAVRGVLPGVVRRGTMRATRDVTG